MQLIYRNDKRDTEIKWEKLRYMVFDCPSPQLVDKIFEKRYLELTRSITTSSSFLILCPRIRCASKFHMKQYLNNIIHNKGEGVILRKPKSAYDKGKSHSLLKIKNMMDTEAVVMSIGKQSLTCKLANGDKILAAKNSKLSVKIGDVVTIAEIVSKKLQLSYYHKINVWGMIYCGKILTVVSKSRKKTPLWKNNT